MNVIPFSPRSAPTPEQPDENSVNEENYYWKCACGSWSFNLRADGQAVCISCEVEAHGDGESVWQARSIPSVQQEENRSDEGEPGDTIYEDSTSDFAYHRIKKTFEQEPMAAVVLIDKNSRVTTWTVCASEPECDWLEHKMFIAWDMLFGTEEEPDVSDYEGSPV